MKTIMIIDVHLSDFDRTIVSVADDHPVVAFCEAWRLDPTDLAYIDPEIKGKEEADLAAMYEELMTLPKMKLPCHIDYQFFYLQY